MGESKRSNAKGIKERHVFEPDGDTPLERVVDGYIDLGLGCKVLQDHADILRDDIAGNGGVRVGKCHGGHRGGDT